MPFGKPKAPKEPKPPKAPKEKKPKKPKKEKPPKPKKGKKGQPIPEEAEGLEGAAEGMEGAEGEEQPKKKIPLIFKLLPLVVIAAAAAIFIFVIRPKLFGDKDPEPSASAEPSPPVLPSELPVGEEYKVPGMVLEADESEAKAVLAKTITYTYIDLVDAGKVAETYVGQLKASEDRFSLVDEEFVRQTDDPDFTAEEGMVLMARNLPKPQPEATAAPEPTATPDPEGSADPDASASLPAQSEAPAESAEPVEETPDMVLTVRITWSPGKCVVTADEEEGKVTSPPPSTVSAPHQVTQRGAVQILETMSPAELGLPGDSMDHYEVLPMDSTELVNDQPCIRLHVYNDNNVPNSNEFMGSYLMSIDGMHLYQVDPITDEIIELDYTPE